MRRPAWLLLPLFALVGLLLLVNWSFPRMMWWRILQDFGHAPLFAVITAAIYLSVRPALGRSAGWALARAGGVGAALGAVTEVLQTVVGRDGAWADLRNNVLGVGVGLAAIAALDMRVRLSRRARVGVGLLAVVGVSIAGVPVARMVQAYLYRSANFPELAGFDPDREPFWVRPLGAETEIADKALVVVFGAERYPGIAWHEPVPDWRGHRTLLLEVSNPSAVALEFTLRVHDRLHTLDYASGYDDRFNRAYTLQPLERRRVAVSLDDVRAGPKKREMDLSQIAEFSIFRSSQAGTALVIHRLALEN